MFRIASLICLALPLAGCDAADVIDLRVEFGPGIVAREQGLLVAREDAEGNLKAAAKAGVACAVSVRAEDPAPGYFYFKAADPWDRLAARLGKDQTLELTLRYFDGARGRMIVSYDSSDHRVKLPGCPDGAWKHPPQASDGIELAGSGTWKTATLRLPLAMFTRRCNGFDLRVEANTPEFALASVALTGVPKGGDEMELVRQQLRLHKATGMVPAGSGARFAGTFAQEANEPIAMEAELATELVLQEGHSPGFDAAASGGAFVHFVASGTWKFAVKTAGTYTMWERASYPAVDGGWSHAERMDDLPGRNIADHNGGSPWMWVRAGEYELAAGEHEFRLSYMGGAMLDLLVLSSERDDPPDLAALRSSYRGAVAGEAWTTPVKPFDVARWRSLDMLLGPRTAGITVELSTDVGRTWMPCEPNADLTKLAVAGSGADSLVFHIKLQAEAGGPPPFYAGGTVVYEAGAENFKVVENGRLRLTIDPYGVKTIEDKRTRQTLLQAPPRHAALVRLITKKPGWSTPRAIDLYSASVEEARVERGGKAGITMTHRLDNGMKLTTTAALRPEGQIEWQLTIDNPTDLEVAEIRFPVLSGCQVGGSAEDDWLFLPKCWGQVLRIAQLNRRLETCWGPSMRWAMLWDRLGGLYLGIEDMRLDDFAFAYKPESAGGLLLAAAQRILVKPKSTWTSATYRVAATGGDWHEGADIYRAYVQRTLKPCDPPPHVKLLVDAWSGQNSNALPGRGWDVISQSADANAARGIQLMPANRQMLDGADSGYCGLYPYPSPVWGSIEEFRQQLAAWRARGGFYTPYHNFHLWSPGYGHYPRIGTFPKKNLPPDLPKPDDAWYRKATTHEYDGGYPKCETNPFAQVGMNLPSREWRNWLAYWTDRYLDWGADGMYYDQFSMIYPNGELREDYPNTYGSWTRATLDTITRLKSEARKKNPYYVSSGEFCNDIYGQVVDLHMTSGVFNRLEFYRYCNPDQILLDGSWNGGTNARYGGFERYRFIWQVGARFEHLTGDAMGRKPEFVDQWLAKMLSLRLETKSLLYSARFMDTVGITIRDAEGKVMEPEYTEAGGQNAPYRGVVARWFLFRQGKRSGAVVNLINAVSRGDGKDSGPVAGAKVTINTKRFGPVKQAVAWTMDGACLPVEGQQEGEVFTFTAPAAELACVVLAGSLPPLVAWTIDPAAAPGATRELKLKITNVNAEALSGKACLQLPAGWKAADAAFGPLAAGRSLEVVLPIKIPADARKGRHDVRCRVATESGSFETYSLVVVSDPVLVEFRGDPGSYHLLLRNLTPQPVSGTVSFQAPAPLQATGPDEFEIAALTEAKLPVGVTGRSNLKTMAEMTASIWIGAENIRRVRGVMPLIENGDFEIDSVGDGKPDGWQARSLVHKWRYERIALADDAAAGKHCLRVDAAAPGDKGIIAHPLRGALEPDRKYTVSVKIRSQAREGAYLVAFGRTLGKGETGGGEWRAFSVDLPPAPRLRQVDVHGIQCVNESRGPVFFDDIRIREDAP